MSLFTLRTTDPERLAQMIAERRVQRGIAFMRSLKEAPIRWQGHLVVWDESGHLRFRGNTHWAEESPLLLILEGQEEFLDKFGYVAHWIVQKRLSLSDRRMIALGFDAPDRIWGDRLNCAWLQALLSYARPDSIRQAHNSALDREWSSFGTEQGALRISWTWSFWWSGVKETTYMYFEPLLLPVKLYRRFKNRKRTA